jgi:BNR repeat-like domain
MRHANEDEMRRIKLTLLVLGLFLVVRVAHADWRPTKRLTWTSGDSEYPAIAVDSFGHLHVVWQDYTPGNTEIFYKKSTDGGASWSSAQRLTWTSEDSLSPAIAVDSSGRLHVVWGDYAPGNAEIYYKKSTDGGTTWTSAQRLTWNAGTSRDPAIAVNSSGHLYVVWQDYTPGNAEIYYKKSTDGGATWTSAQRLTWDAGDCWFPDIAVASSGHLHVVWEDWTPAPPEIYYKKSVNGGTTWTSAQGISGTSGESYLPAIAVDSSDHLHVVWEDNTPGSWEIYYTKSTDGGAAWTPARRITWTSGRSGWPAIAAYSSGHLHVAWEDNTPGNWEIYYRKSADGGATWTSTQRITWTAGVSTRPAVAVDSAGHVHVVWMDETPGNYEIYYKKGTNL